jgi:hypothetical protein
MTDLSPTAKAAAIDKRPRPHLFVATLVVLLAALMVLAGLWCLLAPVSFARLAGYPLSVHFVHDAGAFQLGIGATLAFSLVCREGVVVALAGFFVSNTAHMLNHALDRPLGGHHWDAWLLGTIPVLTGLALIIQVRRNSRNRST